MSARGRVARLRVRAAAVLDPPGWRWMLAAFGLGALAALGQAPLGWWPATLVGLAGAVALLAGGTAARVHWPQPDAGAGRCFSIAWATGTGYFAVALFWIVEPFLVDPARHGWMAPFALLSLAAGLALFWGAAGALAAVLAPGRPGRRALAFGVALALAELARGHVLTGFPWALAGHVWIDTPLAQLAALAGASGLTAVTLMAAALPVAAGLAASPRRRAPLALLAGTLVATSLAAGWHWGAERLAAAAVSPVARADEPLRLRLIQPNAPQHLKWRPDLLRFWFERQLEFTAAAPAAGDRAPDLVIWSETAIPWLLEDAWYAFAMMADAAGQAQVALGVQRLEQGRYYNSLVVLGRGGDVDALYDKHHLVPFGEYVPLAELVAGSRLAGLAGRALAGFSPGQGPLVLDLGAAGRVAPMICYETVFPRHLLAVPRPDWVLQVTNDAWFGRIAGPYQHLAQARFRALEFGLPVVRAANTGVSAVIDARGRVVSSIPLDAAGWVDADLPEALPATPFSRAGEAPLAALLSVVLALFAGLRLRTRD